MTSGFVTPLNNVVTPLLDRNDEASAHVCALSCYTAYLLMMLFCLILVSRGALHTAYHAVDECLALSCTTTPALKVCNCLALSTWAHPDAGLPLSVMRAVAQSGRQALTQDKR